MAKLGECDCCSKWAPLRRAIVCGIETYACSGCSFDPPAYHHFAKFGTRFFNIAVPSDDPEFRERLRQLFS